jgi:3,4-dihydroxy 2-butanone 4-phosphate synthase/GTP cyclohydrolase II
MDQHGTHKCGLTAREPADISSALDALAVGRPLLLIDGGRRRGFLLSAADRVGPAFVQLADRHGHGTICAVMERERLEALRIPELPGVFGSTHAPVALRGRIRPGDPIHRADTLRALADPATTPQRLAIPGHVAPVALGARRGERQAPWRAMVGAVTLAGCAPVAACCEAIDPERPPIGVQAITLADLQVALDPDVERVVETGLPTRAGMLTAVGYRGARSGEEYIAFVRALERPGERGRIHVHRRCQVSDVFGGAPCGCGERLREALQAVQDHGGAVIYHGSETAAWAHDDDGVPTEDLTTEVAAIVRDLGIGAAAVSSNERLAIRDLRWFGLDVVAA